MAFWRISTTVSPFDSLVLLVAPLTLSLGFTYKDTLFHKANSIIIFIYIV